MHIEASVKHICSICVNRTHTLTKYISIQEPDRLLHWTDITTIRSPFPIIIIIINIIKW